MKDGHGLTGGPAQTDEQADEPDQVHASFVASIEVLHHKARLMVCQRGLSMGPPSST